MKHVDEYRSTAACQSLIDEILRLATRRWTLMEVCGGQTHGLLRNGIDTALADVVQLIHGPGCPVCVTPVDDIDLAIQLSNTPGVTVTTFGDMLRVPGSRESLLEAQSQGGRARFVYSPLDALALAEQRPGEQIVFHAVGFETTAPATALAVHAASERQVENFSMIVSHVRVLPAMELLMRGGIHHIDGFLAAGHVCTVTGFREYHEFARRHRVPVVVTGFEPLDLLSGIRQCVEQLEDHAPNVSNQYQRSVREAGNASAIRLMNHVYESCDRDWRGMGTVPRGGLRLKPNFRHLDASERFALESTVPAAESLCPSGDVLSGRLKPIECEQFGKACTPESPLGAPMVSAEGACAAYFRYAKSRDSNQVLGADDANAC